MRVTRLVIAFSITNIWVIPCQVNQRDWHDQLGFLWNFIHLLYHMRYSKTQKNNFFGQVVLKIWVGELWPKPLDREPSNECISARMIARNIMLVSFCSNLEALFNQLSTNFFSFYFWGHIQQFSTLTLTLTPTRFFLNLKKIPFVVSYGINILWKIQSGISTRYFARKVCLCRRYVNPSNI